MLNALLLAAVAHHTQYEPVDLSWKPTPGESHTYKITSTSSMTMGGHEASVESTLNMKIEYGDIEGDSIITRATITDMKATMDGQDLSAPVDTSTHSGKTKLSGGPILDPAKLDDGRQSPRIQVMTALYRPTKPIALNYNFDLDFKGDPALKTVDAKYRLTYTGVENCNGVPCYLVKTVYQEYTDGAPMNAIAQWWIAKKNGATIKYVADYENIQWVKMMPPSSSHTVFERVDLDGLR